MDFSSAHGCSGRVRPSFQLTLLAASSSCAVTGQGPSSARTEAALEGGLGTDGAADDAPGLEDDAPGAADEPLVPDEPHAAVSTISAAATGRVERREGDT